MTQSYKDKVKLLTFFSHFTTTKFDNQTEKHNTEAWLGLVWLELNCLGLSLFGLAWYLKPYHSGGHSGSS